MQENRQFTVNDPLPDVSLGNLTLNAGRYSVLINDLPVDLSVHEFELLALLVQQHDRVLSYATLTELVWQSSDRRHVRHLNVLIHRLRQKLAASHPFAIQTVRGRGYGLIRVRSPGNEDDSTPEARLMAI